MRGQFPHSTEAQINAKIGAYLAQSGDRDGGRKDRALRGPSADVAAADHADESVLSVAASDQDADVDTDDEQ